LGPIFVPHHLVPDFPNHYLLPPPPEYVLFFRLFADSYFHNLASDTSVLHWLARVDEFLVTNTQPRVLNVSLTVPTHCAEQEEDCGGRAAAVRPH
jgi:hypothetical protein